MPRHGSALVQSKWAQLVWMSLTTFLILSLWFSASAVSPEIAAAWNLTPGLEAWLTMSVQLGFALGALASGILNLADRFRTPTLIAVSGFVGASATLGIAWLADGPALGLALRFVTGMAIAGVYPPGMKLIATWAREDRGLAIGILIGAIAVGSAAPHLLAALAELTTGGAALPWRSVLVGAALLAALGAALTLAFAREGPHRAPLAQFRWAQAAQALRNPATRLANFGYLGHMWELFAVWTWLPLLLVASYRSAGLSSGAGRFAGFAMIAIGGIGCIAAGAVADRWGRTRVAEASLWVSGGCALLAGFVLDQPVILTGLCLVWGFAVIADSAQFSAAVSELADPSYVGTALTIQTSLGFLLTLVSIWVVPILEASIGWHAALALLAAGPAFGIWSMRRLRARPEARRLAMGRG